MRLKLDENLSRRLKEPLVAFGHDVQTVLEEGLCGRSDVEVGAAAKREGRLLLTLDVEYADLRKYPPGDHPGVILFRPISMGPSTVNRFVADFIRDSDLSVFHQCLVVVDPEKTRIRKPPPP